MRLDSEIVRKLGGIFAENEGLFVDYDALPKANKESFEEWLGRTALNSITKDSVSNALEKESQSITSTPSNKWSDRTANQSDIEYRTYEKRLNACLGSYIVIDPLSKGRPIKEQMTMRELLLLPKALAKAATTGTGSNIQCKVDNAYELCKAEEAVPTALANTNLTNTSVETTIKPEVSMAARHTYCPVDLPGIVTDIKKITSVSVSCVNEKGELSDSIFSVALFRMTILKKGIKEKDPLYMLYDRLDDSNKTKVNNVIEANLLEMNKYVLFDDSTQRIFKQNLANSIKKVMPEMSEEVVAKTGFPSVRLIATSAELCVGNVKAYGK